MADLFGYLLGGIHKFLTMPAWPGDCKNGYLRTANKNGQEYCLAIPPDGPEDKMIVWPDSDKSDPFSRLWLKDSVGATPANLATSLTCPVGTFAYNGKCYGTCPKGFTLYSREVKDGNSMREELECLATCQGGWHALDWVPLRVQEDWPPEFFANGTEKMFQAASIARNDDLCWHPPAPETMPGVPNWKNMPLQEKIGIPPNLFFQHEQTVAVEAVQPVKAPGVEGRPLQPFKPGQLLVEAPGIYAARMRFEAGAAELPQECVSPYLLTTNGRCVRKCSNGYELHGDVCFDVLRECPTTSRPDPKHRGRCIPKFYKPIDGPSILVVFIGLAAISVIGGLLIKFVIDFIKK